MKKILTILLLLCCTLSAAKNNKKKEEDVTLQIKLSDNSDADIHYVHLSYYDDKGIKKETHSGALTLTYKKRTNSVTFPYREKIYITRIHAKHSKNELSPRDLFEYDIESTGDPGIPLYLQTPNYPTTKYTICIEKQGSKGCSSNAYTKKYDGILENPNDTEQKASLYITYKVPKQHQTCKIQELAQPESH